MSCCLQIPREPVVEFPPGLFYFFKGVSDLLLICLPGFLLFRFIPSVNYKNISVFQDFARTLLSHVPFSWVAKKSRSMPRWKAPHAAWTPLHSLAMLPPWIKAELLLSQQGKAPFQLTRSCILCETGQAEWEPSRWKQRWVLKTREKFVCLFLSW